MRVYSGVLLDQQIKSDFTGERDYLIYRNKTCKVSSTEAGGGRVVRWCWANFQYRGVLLIWIRVGQGPSVLAVGAGGGCLDISSLVYHFSFFSLSLGDGPI